MFDVTDVVNKIRSMFARVSMVSLAMILVMMTLLGAYGGLKTLSHSGELYAVDKITQKLIDSESNKNVNNDIPKLAKEKGYILVDLNLTKKMQELAELKNKPTTIRKGNVWKVWKKVDVKKVKKKKRKKKLTRSSQDRLVLNKEIDDIWDIYDDTVCKTST